MSELRKQLDIGSFILSDKAIDAMNALMRRLDASTTTTDWTVHLQAKLEAVDECLADMRRIARRELNAKGG